MTVSDSGKRSFYLRVFLSGAAVALMLAEGLPASARMGASPEVVGKVFRGKDTLVVACSLNGSACTDDAGASDAALSASRVWRDGPGEQDFQAETGVAFATFISYGPSLDHFCAAIGGGHRCVEVSLDGGPNSSCPNVIDVEADQDRCDAVADLLSLDPLDVDYVVELNQDLGLPAKLLTCSGVVAQCLALATTTPQVAVSALAHTPLGTYDGTRTGGSNYR